MAAERKLFAFSKTAKKKEKEEKIALAFKHKEAYLRLSEKDRLACLDISPGCFHYLCRSVKDRLQRERVIPQEDIEGVVRQIIALPFLEGRKGALKLVEDQQALVGEDCL